MNLNKVILIGRISQQISTFQSKTGLTYVRFNLAVSRDSYGNNDKNEITDFIPIVAFGNNATFVSRFFNKGDLVSIVGSIQISQYTTKSGDIASSSTVVVDQIKSLEPINVTRERAEKNGNNNQELLTNLHHNEDDQTTFYQEQNQALEVNEPSKDDEEDNPWELDL